MVYEIFEENMDRLEKKLLRISNKCKKYGCDFHYKKIGETFHELTNDNGKKYIAKFIQIEAEGNAIINDWKFIASVEHTENGNIIKKCCYDVEVPKKYYTSKPVCEHCNSSRFRKSTYIVQNLNTGEFKQVGKSCLADFTKGLSVEYVAHYISLFDTLIEGECVEPGSCTKTYIELKEALRYIAETIRHFGYVKADEGRPTKIRALDYYKTTHGFSTFRSLFQEEMNEVCFNADSDYAEEISSKALGWILEQDENNDYIHNLKTVCSADYVTINNFGILASLFPAYNRAMEKIQKDNAEKNAEKESEYVGQIGERIIILISESKIVTSWETQYGMTAIFKITDINGNIFIWKTSSGISERTRKISATVKCHKEYNGIKQTEITRCRIL